jgi:serine/threonine protein kinase
MIGKVVGNYRIAEKIGEGGMGTVYRAVDLMLERDVALKAIRPELSSEPQIIERFRAEARTLARISHPAIANVYTFFYEGEELFLVMEYVRGRPLSRVLQAEGALPWQRAVLFLATAMEGIAEAHRAGIVHRDLKPDNLILTETGTVKVMDFGIARVMGSGHLTRTGLLVGTLRYMSPEQIRGEEVDGRTDVYALGAVLYEMLTGRTPFEGTSDWAILRAQIEDTPRPPGEQVPSIPWWLDRAVLRALSKQPAERFQSVEEMRRSLLRQGETLESPYPAGGSIEDLPTVITPIGVRQTPAPLTPSPAPNPGMTPPPTLPSMASIPTAASAALPPVPPPPSTPPPAPTSYRPVELGRPGGAGRKAAIIALAVFAFVGVVMVGLVTLSSFWTPKPPADGTATDAAATDAAADSSATQSAPIQDAEKTEPESQSQRTAAASTEPAAVPLSAPPLPRPAPRKPEPLPEAGTTEEPAAPPETEEPAASTYTPEEPPSTASQGPVEEIHRLAGEVETRNAELVDQYSDFLSKKEDSGAELTDDDQKLKDHLDDLQEAAEKFNGQFDIGFFGRLRGRRADDRRRIGQNFRNLARLAGEVDRLMADVRPSPEVRQSWGEIRRRWQRVAEIVRGF